MLTVVAIRCASWAAVAADLSAPAWVDALLAAGLDPAVPTVWVAEGLLVGSHACSTGGGGRDGGGVRSAHEVHTDTAK